MGFAFEIEEILAVEFGNEGPAIGHVGDNDGAFAAAEHGTGQGLGIFIVVLMVMDTGGFGFLRHGVLSV